jgi:hypothetical protein
MLRLRYVSLRSVTLLRYGFVLYCIVLYLSDTYFYTVQSVRNSSDTDTASSIISESDMRKIQRLISASSSSPFSFLQYNPLSHHRQATTMKLGARSFSLFLLASQDAVLSTSAFRPLSFRSGVTPGTSTATSTTRRHKKEYPFQQQTCSVPLSSLLHSARGGASSSMSTTTTTTTSSSTALNSAVASSEETTTPVEIFRKDYDPLPHVVSKINMDFSIQEGKTTVVSELFLEPNSNYNGQGKDMVLDGDETSIKLMRLTLNGRPLEEGTDYTLEPGKLIIINPPAGSVLKTTVELVPEDNTQLSGLYKSGPMYCTQCEAMGFRRITYYPDRPDNMAIFERVRLEADQEAYPILLANGNLLESGALDNGRHYAVWSDPFPKPSYLFCCVAGSLGNIKDSFTTMSGREVTLQLFSEAHNVHKLGYAMESLKRSMKWDEDKYGLEYDLDLYNIVAVDSFNMGAMENKVRFTLRKDANEEEAKYRRSRNNNAIVCLNFGRFSRQFSLLRTSFRD